MKINLPKFDAAKVLVVGDVMLDRYWQGDVERISPEAPVPVVHVQKSEDRVGGAGNVALNIHALGSQVGILGLVGDDEAAKVIESKLNGKHISNNLLHVPGVSTISKLRVIGHGQQLIRLDFEDRFEGWDDKEFFSRYEEQLAWSDLVILSDYGKGTLRNVRKLIEIANKMNKPVLVDPKSRDFSLYRGATLVTPNLVEFENVVGRCSSENDIKDKALNLLQQYELEAILVTRGNAGMSLICKDKEDAIHIPADAKEVYDVTGAGDTVIATLGAALAAGQDISEAMVIANIAAGEAVKKVGTTTVSISELRRALQRKLNFLEGILDEERLIQHIRDAREHGEKIVMTNGCFDILHSGHVTYLEKAKALGDRLIVAVNDDQSVSRLKGPTRPINQAKHRMQVLSALGSVDWVVMFSEDTPERLIKLVSPDVLVKGGDYKVNEIAGSDHVLENGGEVIIASFEEGFSTSNTLEKIKKNK